MPILSKNLEATAGVAQTETLSPSKIIVSPFGIIASLFLSIPTNKISSL